MAGKSKSKESKSKGRQFNTLQKQYWDSKQDYERLNRNHLKKIRKIEELAGLKKNDRKKVLEVGAGTGTHARKLLEDFPMLDYHGVDISEGMLKKARQILRGYNARLRAGDAEKLPFKKNTFDAVYCNATLHHLSNPEKGFSEMVRVLRPGGRVVVMEPNILFIKNFLQAVLMPSERNNFRITKKILKAWAEKNRLKDIETCNFIYTIPWPEFMTGFYDILDSLFSRIPIIRQFSIQIYLRARK